MTCARLRLARGRTACVTLLCRATQRDDSGQGRNANGWTYESLPRWTLDHHLAAAGHCLNVARAERERSYAQSITSNPSMTKPMSADCDALGVNGIQGGARQACQYVQGGAGAKRSRAPQAGPLCCPWDLAALQPERRQAEGGSHCASHRQERR